MSGLLTTTLTGSMEAIQVGPVEGESLKVSCSKSGPTNERLLPSDPDTRADLSSTAQPGAGTENDPSISNALKPELPKSGGLGKSHSTPNSQSRHSLTTRTDGGTGKTGVAGVGKSERNDAAGAPRPCTESVKRNTSAEEEAKTKTQEGRSPAAPAKRVGEADAGIGSPAASVGRATFFVKDWEFVQTLGEGAYGE